MKLEEQERVKPERMDSIVKGAWIGKPKEARLKKVKEKDLYSGSIKIAETKKPRFLISFDDEGKVIGELKIRNGKLHFEGKAEKSAKLLFDALKGLVDDYIKKAKEK